MGNMFDYLEWRGDLTFDCAPFNEVDSLLFSWLVYVAFDGIVPESQKEQPIRIRDASRLFFRTHDLERILKETLSCTRNSAQLLKCMAESRRFSDVLLTGFVNRIDYEKETQFSAMTLRFGNHQTYVAFRGTDDTLVGWKEDFNMSFLPTVPAQVMAKEYLEEAARFNPGPLYVGGHSKGGNLAVYAGVTVSEPVRKRIERIYNNDGPGFADLEKLEPVYSEMLPKTETYVPQSSIVGMLLEREGDYVVVQSAAWGLHQHDASSWQISGDHFVTVAALSETSQLITDTLREWLTHISTEQREHFVEVLYGILETTQAKTTEELNAEKRLIANTVLKNYGSLDKETKTMLSKAIRALFKAGNQAIRTKKTI